MSLLIIVLSIAIIWLVIVLLYGFGNTETILIICFMAILVAIWITSFVHKSKYYLAEVKLGSDDCEFIIYKYDKVKATLKTKTSETRIKIVMLYFPFSKLGANYKLVVETKMGVSYRPIIQQYELGNWSLATFKEVLSLYGKVKGVNVSPSLYNRTMF